MNRALNAAVDAVVIVLGVRLANELLSEPKSRQHRRYSERLRYLKRCAMCLTNTDERLIHVGREWAHRSCVDVISDIVTQLERVE